MAGARRHFGERGLVGFARGGLCFFKGGSARLVEGGEPVASAWVMSDFDLACRSGRERRDGDNESGEQRWRIMGPPIPAAMDGDSVRLMVWADHPGCAGAGTLANADLQIAVAVLRFS